MADQVQQLQQDVDFITPFIDGNIPFTSQHKTTLQNVLQRVAQMGGRRGGPTKNNLMHMATLLPGDATFTRQNSKAEMAAGLLQMLARVPDVPAQQVPPPPDNADTNVRDLQQEQNSEVPVGWEQFFDRDHHAGDTDEDRILLQIKRGSATHTPHRLLQLLLSEQEDAKEAQRQRDPVFEQYIRSNLQVLADNPHPLPIATPSRIVWSIYFRVLQDQIDRTAKELDADGSQVSQSSSHSGKRSSQRQPSSSDSDLDSYAPKKRFAPVRYKSKRKKKRKKKKRRRSHSDSDSSSSSSSDDDIPNSKRVRSSAYDATHMERLQEFRDEHKEFYRNGCVGWPSDDALSFIAKKFARPGSTFASKSVKGVKRAFGNNRTEKEHARTRTNQIYEMSDEVCVLRQERNERLADLARKREGASEAKRARLKQRSRKFLRASVREEQALVSKVSLYCDLVLLGKSSWDAFHAEIDLRGQQSTVVESLGGSVSTSVASKAWKTAQKLAFTQKAKRTTNTNAGDNGSQQKSQQHKKIPCYWCNKMGHLGRNCADKLAGKPFHPQSRAASWPEDKIAAVKKKRSAIKVEKPKQKK